MNKLLAVAFASVLVLTACDKNGENQPSANAVPIPAVGETVEFGGYGWKVLDEKDGDVLLLSERILEERRYAESGAATWEECELRQYLNGAFYDSFGKSRGKIVRSANANRDNPWFGTEGGNETEDYIFALSIDEVARYFGDSGQLANPQGGFGLSLDDGFNRARIALNSEDKAGWWWLRSPGGLSDGAAFVSTDGTVYISGNKVETKSGGVRPAMWVNLNGEDAEEIVTAKVADIADAVIGDKIEFGGYGWIALDVTDDRILLLSEKVIMKIKSDDKTEEEGVMYITGGIRDAEVHYDAADATWEGSPIRQYLNAGLLFQLDLILEDKRRIILSSNANPDNPWFKTKAGATTEEYIFLLSLDEAVKYFGDSGQSSFRPDNAYSIDDKFNGSRIAYDRDGNACRWCLRTAGLYENQLVCVGTDGKINIDGTSDFQGGSVGIRPAMWIKK